MPHESMVDPRGCAQKIIDCHGAVGAAWLEQLPALVADCAERWSLTVLPPFPALSYNYVAPVVRADGTPAVLKCGVPYPDLWREIEALRLFAGQGIARLLEADPALGAILMERLLPGTPLTTMEDADQATTIAIGVMSRLWRAAPAEHPFRSAAQWAAGLSRLHAHYEGYGPFPPALVDRAEAVFRELLQTDAAPSLIHGDANPTNILRSQRQPWLAIDPKGAVGDPLWDVATYLNDPPRLGSPMEQKRLLGRRVDQFAAGLDVERERILQWGLAQAVLSGWWSVEDHGHGWEFALGLAALYAELL